MNDLVPMNMDPASGGKAGHRRIAEFRWKTCGLW